MACNDISNDILYNKKFNGYHCKFLININRSFSENTDKDFNINESTIKN